MLLMKTKTFFPARLTLRENVGVFYLAKCRFDPRCYLFYPARLTLRETLSGSPSRPVLLREKLGLSAWLSAFSLTTLSIVVPCPSYFAGKISGFSSRPVLLCGKTRVISAKCRFTFSSRPVFNYCGKNAGYFGKEPFQLTTLYQVSHPARLTLRGHNSQGLRPPPVLLCRQHVGVLSWLSAGLRHWKISCPARLTLRELEFRDLLVTSYFAPAVLLCGLLTHLSHFGDFTVP